MFTLSEDTDAHAPELAQTQRIRPQMLHAAQICVPAADDAALRKRILGLLPIRLNLLRSLALAPADQMASAITYLEKLRLIGFRQCAVTGHETLVDRRNQLAQQRTRTGGTEQ